MAVAAYIDKYLECVEAMPQDLQRNISDMREIERRTSGLVAQLRRLRSAAGPGAGAGGEGDRRELLVQLQTCLCEFRKAGDEKVAITSRLLDAAEDYSQELGLRAKDLDKPRSLEELQPARHAHTSQAASRAELAMLGLEVPPTDKPLQRRSSNKRPRLVDREEAEEAVREGVKEGGARSRENSTSNGLAGAKLLKKKNKMKKKVVVKDAAAVAVPLASPPQAPMPDLSSQPLDPDEPTYCLCKQVSFGEMIGCDNEECQIEWFHFQCVGLTSKPKGKWFCPQCTKERKQRNSKPGHT